MKTYYVSAIIGLALAVLGSAITLPTVVQADTFGQKRYYPEEAILDWSGERFTIQRIDFYAPTDDERLRLETWMRNSPDLIDALQNTIAENGEFARALSARSVQLHNVVAIQQALNGNLVVFLR